MRWAIWFYVLLAVGAWGYAALFGDLRTLFGERAPDAADTMRGVGIGIGIVVAYWGAHHQFQVVRRFTITLGAFLGPMTSIQACFLGLLSGFAEELTFRGALWPDLGLWGTSLLFAALHIVPVRAAAGYPIFALLAGLLLGWLRESTGSVWPPIFAHVTINTINLSVIGAMLKRDG
ncbi:MAG: CPBP family intramembrane glutamic endopeptidase [Planctomycetota bacterium]